MKPVQFCQTCGNYHTWNEAHKEKNWKALALYYQKMCFELSKKNSKDSNDALKIIEEIETSVSRVKRGLTKI